MTMSARVAQYLDQQHIDYQLVQHPHSHSSIGTAISAEVPLHHIAKAVVLNDDYDHHLMAVLPADYKLSLSLLNEEFGNHFHLSKEADVYQMFADCDQGAVPPVPSAYQMDAVVDPTLLGMSDIYLESGDHETLIHMMGSEFAKLMKHFDSLRCGHRAYH